MRHRKSPASGTNTHRATRNNITVIINMKGGVVNMHDITSTTQYQRLVRTGYAGRQCRSFSCPDCGNTLGDKLYIAGTIDHIKPIGCGDCINVETRQNMQDMDIYIMTCPCCGEPLDDYDKVYVRDLEIVSCESCTDAVRTNEYRGM